MGSRDRYYSVLYRAAVRRSLSIRRIDYFYSGWHTYGIVFSQYVWLGPASRPFVTKIVPFYCTVQADHGAVGATAGHTGPASRPFGITPFVTNSCPSAAPFKPVMARWERRQGTQLLQNAEPRSFERIPNHRTSTALEHTLEHTHGWLS